MSNNITILIPTSPIPSHPSTETLDETITNIRKYTQADIIIMFDGVFEGLSHRTEDYEIYKHLVFLKIEAGIYGNCSYKEFSHHRHQSEMMKQVLNEVYTDLIMFVEHDCSPIGEIPFNEICDLVLNSEKTNCVRFNIFEKIPDEHSYLMIGKEVEMGIPLTRTIQFSARPNIAKTNWYRELLFDYFPDGKRIMIEDGIYGAIIERYKHLGYDTFGLAIYSPQGNELRSYTSDGRKDDPKIIQA